MDWGLVLALWLHTVAFVIAWGYYGILARMVLPALDTRDGPARVALVASIERRALPLLAVAIVAFLLTGGYLMVTDPEYAGLGNIRASTWATLMLVKHLAVAAMIVAGVVVDLLIRDLAAADPDDDRALRRVRRSAEVATGLGALIALLTAAAQAA